MSVDPDLSRPMFLQLADLLRAQILSGAIGPDRKLPSVSELMAAHQIGKGTAARAVTVLLDEGLAVLVPGRGAYAADAATIRKAKSAAHKR